MICTSHDNSHTRATATTVASKHQHYATVSFPPITLTDPHHNYHYHRYPSEPLPPHHHTTTTPPTPQHHQHHPLPTTTPRGYNPTGTPPVVRHPINKPPLPHFYHNATIAPQSLLTPHDPHNHFQYQHHDCEHHNHCGSTTTPSTPHPTIQPQRHHHACATPTATTRARPQLASSSHEYSVPTALT